MYDEAIELLFRERPMHFYGYVLNFGQIIKKQKQRKQDIRKHKQNKQKQIKAMQNKNHILSNVFWYNILLVIYC
jgi:hypothetical protein